MAHYSIEPGEQTLHGFFSPELSPILTIEPGDTVAFRTLDAGWGLENYPRVNPTPGQEPPRPKARSVHGEPYGHALCGPIAIRGAAPGMTLAIQIDAIVPGAWGWTWAGGDLVGGEETLHLWEIDVAGNTAVNQDGQRVTLGPFMGVMGVAPAEPGHHITAPPRTVGGNLDCKELVAGSTLYLPIAVAGALFSVGDGHARQGDGEVSRTAIECPIERCELTFTLRNDLQLAGPRANTPAGWLTFGLNEDLNIATRDALLAMLDLMGELHGLSRLDALALASVVVDMHITQIANGVHGVHAVLPHDALL